MSSPFQIIWGDTIPPHPPPLHHCQKALNLTYVRASAITIFFPGLYPRTPVRRGKGREEREVRERRILLGGKGKEIEGRGVGKEEYGQEGKGRGGEGKGMHRSSPFRKF
jgi:hypothetical protein